MIKLSEIIKIETGKMGRKSILKKVSEIMKIGEIKKEQNKLKK